MNTREKHSFLSYSKQNEIVCIEAQIMQVCVITRVLTLWLTITSAATKKENAKLKPIIRQANDPVERVHKENRKLKICVSKIISLFTHLTVNRYVCKCALLKLILFIRICCYSVYLHMNCASCQHERERKMSDGSHFTLM